MKKICDLDIEKYKCVAPGIRTSEVIITEERIQHIKSRHPNDFERYSKYLEDILKNPNYILESDMPHTAFILKKYAENGEQFQLILRIVIEGENPKYKNSVITFLRISERTWNKYLRNKKILYKSE